MRSRLLHRKSLSESDVRGHLEASGPPISVDELWRWRRRPAPQPPPLDSLQPCPGSMAEATSEYRYSFGIWPPMPSPPPQSLNFGEDSTEHADNFIRFTHLRRANLQRRRTNLFLEGDLDMETESQKQYREFPATPRPVIPRPRTTLSPEGRLEFVTESRNQFSALLLSPRTRPRRPRSNLTTEGDFEFLTESMKEFREVPLPPKNKVFRPKTNLISQGALEFLTETREEFSQLLRRPKAVTTRRPRPPSTEAVETNAIAQNNPLEFTDPDAGNEKKSKEVEKENETDGKKNQPDPSKRHRPIYLDPEFIRPPPSPPQPGAPGSRLAQIHRVTAIVPAIYPPPIIQPRLSRPRRKLIQPSERSTLFDCEINRPRRVVRIATEPKHCQLDSNEEDSSTVTCNGSDDFTKYRPQRHYIPNSFARQEIKGSGNSAFVVLDANNNRSITRNPPNQIKSTKEGRSPSEPGRWMAPWYQTT